MILRRGVEEQSGCTNYFPLIFTLTADFRAELALRCMRLYADFKSSLRMKIFLFLCRRRRETIRCMIRLRQWPNIIGSSLA